MDVEHVTKNMKRNKHLIKTDLVKHIWLQSQYKYKQAWVR
jgi:hypothetical protein